MAIPRQNWQQWHQRNIASEQFAYHRCCNGGECLAKTYFICQNCFWHVWIPDPSPYKEPYCTILVQQILGSFQVTNCILVAWDLVSFHFANWPGNYHPECLTTTLVIEFVIDYIADNIHHWSTINWFNDLVTILHLLLNLPCTVVCFLFIFNDVCQLVQCMLDWWIHSLALLNFFIVLCISETINHHNEYREMEYNRFYSFHQNLHLYRYQSPSHNPPLSTLFHPLLNLPKSI